MFEYFIIFIEIYSRRVIPTGATSQQCVIDNYAVKHDHCFSGKLIQDRANVISNVQATKSLQNKQYETVVQRQIRAYSQEDDLTVYDYLAD